ncbi:hypothetical protein HD554DRAFT_2310743 [Boletus coccyginus]|nr:hypothetical protein HD554DRAFT_2310743 [Boletus coccyginus]
MSSSPINSPRLILLPNTDDRDPLEDYATDDDDNEHNGPQPGINHPPLPPLPPSVVFLYLLSPYLRLGAIYASDIDDASLTYGLTALFVAAALSAFCRHIWFLLGRYMRKPSTEDIVVHMFPRRHRGARRRGLARSIFTIISGSFRLLLAAMYLRDSVDSVLLLQLPKSIPSLSRRNISILLSILVFVLSIPRSLASRSIVYTTGLSIASYLAWLVAVSRSYGTNNLLPPSLGSSRRGVLWNEISSYAFACATAMTVPLSASLIAGTPSASLASRNAKARSFELLNLSSTVLAALLMLPLVTIHTASPYAPTSTTTSDNLILGLRIAILVLSIPSIVVSVISLPFHHGVAYHFLHTDLALYVITVVILALSLVPPTVASILDDVILFLAVFGAFLLPALAHITIHYFRRPLAIVVPHAPSSVPNSPRSSDLGRSPSPSRDPLLQRKEWLLQRSRFGKRLLWDVVVWIVLIPTCICALVWAAGRLARRW